MPSDEHLILVNENRRCKTERADANCDLPDLLFRMRACVPRVRSDLVDGHDRVRVRHDIPPFPGARAVAAAQSATSCSYGVNRSGAIVMRESPAHHRYALPAHCCLGDSQYGIAPTNVLEQQIFCGRQNSISPTELRDLAQGITFPEITL